MPPIASAQFKPTDTPNPYPGNHRPEEGRFTRRRLHGRPKSYQDRQGQLGGHTSLCGSWGSQSKSLTILDIELGTHRYYTHASNGTEADVEVVNGATGKYLRTDPDKTTADNLADLPDC
jgi:hypothetical protein